ncbi:hypothetical protein HID58_032402 [Brassica napus]|uniref:Uncharacterized protein n=1 Tax=Brassica napus TaxID=3708 RepID=A0ABQ8BY19_BRANA|nr:hypothetical protein HID58_032402 [Brassica napus]
MSCQFSPLSTPSSLPATGADRLIKKNRNVTERSVAAHDGEAEDRRECKNLQKLTAGEDVLTGSDSGDVDHGGAVGAQESVCEKDSYVGTEPGGDAAVRTEGDTVGEERKKGFPLEEAEECGGFLGMSMTVGVVVAAASNFGLLIRRVVHD